ncbi:MAG: arsenate reductase (glutaredoxin) [Crocinitomicaceae bacterium]|nr:arsenate reductase (glutaredoxin) [Crocinitomicaceae bacterium]
MEDKMKITVYHNPRCSKSRMAVQYLEEKGEKFDVIEYLKTTPTRGELQEILSKLEMSAMGLMRKNEADFKQHVAGKELTEAGLIDTMIEYPKLIERPIVIKSNKAVIARPTERIDEII